MAVTVCRRLCIISANFIESQRSEIEGLHWSPDSARVCARCVDDLLWRAVDTATQAIYPYVAEQIDRKMEAGSGDGRMDCGA
jgi:hypothetical protein